jgi:pimeloyl-ACP methyl ester carboxylesterase
MSSPPKKKSTIVRAKTAMMHRSVRMAFRVLEHTAPALGSRWAERIWLTVPPRAWRPRTPVAVPAGEAFAVTVGVSTVRGEVWGTGPVVYLLHGWGGTRRQLDAFVAPLLATGHRVVALDAPGHGESSPSHAGRRLATLPDFVEALTAAAQRFGPARAVVAHSFGTSAAVLALLDGLPAERLAVIAPMGDPIGFSHGFAAMLGFGERIRTGFLAVLEKRVGKPMSAFDVPNRLAAAEPGTLPPLFAIHDLGDREIPVRSGQDLVRRWPGAEFRTTTGLGHNRILVDADAVAQVVAFVATGSVGSAEVSGVTTRVRSTALTGAADAARADLAGAAGLSAASLDDESPVLVSSAPRTPPGP